MDVASRMLSLMKMQVAAVKAKPVRKGRGLRRYEVNGGIARCVLKPII